MSRYRVNPDGTIDTDSLAEAVAASLEMERQRRVAKLPETPAASSTRARAARVRSKKAHLEEPPPHVAAFIKAVAAADAQGITSPRLMEKLRLKSAKALPALIGGARRAIEARSNGTDPRAVIRVVRERGQDTLWTADTDRLRQMGLI